MWSEQLFEFFNRQASITYDCGHRVSVDGIIARDDNTQGAFRHENVFALAIDVETRFLQRFDRARDLCREASASTMASRLPFREFHIVCPVRHKLPNILGLHPQYCGERPRHSRLANGSRAIQDN